MASNKFFNAFLYTELFFIILFSSAILSYRLVLKGEMVTLPDLVGKTYEEAKIELEKRKLAVDKKGEQFDSQWERGRVIFQDPSAGSKLKINKAVKVILSAGSERVTVPAFIGKNFQLLGDLLKESGLTKGKISQVHTPSSAGKIIAQNPPPSEEVSRNSSVSLLVSQGETLEKYLMPDLIGKQAETVVAKLRELNFRVEDVRPTYYPGLNPGIVIKQFPLCGYVIQKNYPITLEVSK
jgi:beta-lactam-binding protein with PASTA domain